MTIKKKVSVWFVSLKVLEATVCVGVKTKRPTRNSVCIRETPVKVCGVCPRRQKILGTALVTHFISRTNESSACFYNMTKTKPTKQREK